MENKEFELSSIETKEGEPKHNEIIVDFLRHGDTQYLENSISEKDKEVLDGKYPRDLTPEGESQVEKSAEEIVSTINSETDIVVLWSSPAWRAQGSEEILKELLAKKGIDVYKDSSVTSMRNFEQRDMGFINDLLRKIASAGKSPELMYARDPELQEKNDKFETQPEVKRRAERVFNWIRYLAEHANLEGKRLRIIGVSHFEFINPIMEDIFGSKAEEGEGVVKGEGINVKFGYDLESKKMNISANFRGEHKDGITFDKEKRRFIAEK